MSEHRDDSNQPNSRHRNPKDMKDEYDRTLGLIEQGQIKEDSTERSDFNAYKELDDVAKDFSKTDFTADGHPKGETQLPIGKSMDRFCFSHEPTEESKDQGTKVRGMKLNQQTDKPSD